MKKLIFKICLAAFLAFWQDASSYIYQIRQFYNPTTKKVIFMLSDQHIMGDRKQNLEQLEEFKKIIELLKKKKLMSQILFEDLTTYAYDFESFEKYIKKENIDEKTFKTSFFLYGVEEDAGKINSYLTTVGGLACDYPDLMGDLVPYCFCETNQWVKYKSIDPRFIFQLWLLKEKFAAIHLFKDMADFLIDFCQVRLFKQQNYLRAKKINNSLNTILSEIFPETMAKNFIKKIKKHKTTNPDKITKIVNKYLYTNNSIAWRGIDHEALLHICCDHDFKYTFLVAGGTHVNNLSVFMGRLGFDLSETWGITIEKAVALGSNLPDVVKQMMDAEFDKVHYLIAKDIYGLPICREIGDVSKVQAPLKNVEADRDFYPNKKRKLDEDNVEIIVQKN